MTITPGTKLGSYEITSLMGVGGMGEVYRARDTKLDRDVAIKVLPDAFATDDERLARFEREAKLLASLNHPNIASIYGLEESDGVKALVLELVEGPTLAERIEEGPIPVDETIAIARQIAEALEAGHDAGVIHRDLKPANVKLKEDGTVKVLDYGLAKALEGEALGGDDSELSQSPTLTRRGTQIGTILGTAAYMSPEQAKGKRVDKRADVWAFGAVVYEMLTGERAFAGQDVSDTLAAVLRAEPDFDALPAGTPHAVRQALRLCLTKDLKGRVRAMGDVALALDGAFDGAPADEGRTRPSGTVGVAAFLLGVLVAGALAWSVLRPNPPRVMRFTTEVDQLLPTPGEGIKITPDGRTLVYVGERHQVFRRALDEAEATAIAGTEGTQQIVVSPDGRWLGLLSRGNFRKLPLEGGAAVTVLDAVEPRGFSWGDDGTIVFGSFSRGLGQVPDTGGEPERVTEAASGRNHNRPFHLPDGKGLLFNDWSAEDSRIAVLPAGSREPRTLLEGTSPLLAPTGHMLFQRGGSLWAVSFDLNRLDVDGEPVPVIEGIEPSQTGAKRYDVARNGTLIYMPASSRILSSRRIDWIDREGVVTAVFGQVRGAANVVALAPDGNRIAIPRGAIGVEVFDVERQSRSLVTSDRAGWVVWTPDGARITYIDFSDTSVRSASGRVGEAPEILYQTVGGGRALRPQSWSPDGQAIALDTFNDGGIWILSNGGEPDRILATSTSSQWPTFSPDGRYLAFVSDESGRDEVYVQSYPDLRDKWTVSANGGTRPRWSPDGAELFYRSQGHLMVVDVGTEPSFSAGTPRLLLDSDQLAAYAEGFHVSPDGERFLFVEAVTLRRKRSLVVILNWTEELKRLVPIR